MLYTYREVQHSVYNLHTNICFFFEHLFDLEPNPYDKTSLIDDNFLQLINNSQKFRTYLKDIGEKYIQLPDNEKIL